MAFVQSLAGGVGNRQRVDGGAQCPSVRRHFGVGVVVSVGIANGEQRVGVHQVVYVVPIHASLGDAAFAAMPDVYVLAYGNHIVGVVVGAEQGMRGVQADVVAVELRLVLTAQDTVLPGVGEAEGELRCVGTACQVDGVVLGYGAFVIGLVNPVRPLPAVLQHVSFRVEEALVDGCGELCLPLGFGCTAVELAEPAAVDIFLGIQDVGGLI